MAWNPSLYMRHSSPRLEPALALLSKTMNSLSRNNGETVKNVLDLGCGPGNITPYICKAFPNASVTGIDSSPEMIQAARKEATSLHLPRVTFDIKNMEDYCGGATDSKQQFDVVYSNAAFHWIAEQTLIKQALVNLVRPGGVMAIQMPDTRTQPSHTLMKEAAINCGFGDIIKNVRIPRADYDCEWYYDLLQPHCQRIDMWSTEYVQQLPLTADIHPVLQYTSSTGLRPVIAAIREHHSDVAGAGVADAAEKVYLAEYTRLLSMHYPKRIGCNKKDTITLFPFRRLFFVATRSDASVG